MSSDDSLASRTDASLCTESDRAALMRRANGFVVVSWWQERSGDDAAGTYEYEHRRTLNDALDTYREYEDGDHARARAVGIFAALNGLPVVSRLEPAELMRLMRETRNGA
ncbi:MAG: hypothetical protein ACOY4R_28255 [Pseudomonadota bacterium]